MSSLLSWMPLNELGWTLVHFLWQGLVLAALLHTVLPMCRAAITRHNLALLTLVLMALAPVVTFMVLHNAANDGMTPGRNVFVAVSASTPPAFAPRMDWLVLAWLGGVFALSVRAIGGWTLANALARRGTISPSPTLLQRCHKLQHRLSVTAPVRFLLSYRITTPVVIGFLKPVVLIPVSALAALSPQQLDALVLHELAHIRRLDTVTNILLAAVETVLFYHPAVWWVSRQVRIERENCCDDQAVSACGDAGLYVEALASLESAKGNGLALAANGGKLKDRVERLLDAPAQSRRLSLSASTGLVLVGALAASLAMAQTPSNTAAYPSRDKSPVMLRPIQETHQLPPYPKESLDLKEEGRVLVEVTIGTDGAVSQAVVVGPSGHERLDSAAANFVKGYWRWQPAQRAGKRVTAVTRVNVAFKLTPKKS